MSMFHQFSANNLAKFKLAICKTSSRTEEFVEQFIFLYLLHWLWTLVSVGHPCSVHAPAPAAVWVGGMGSHQYLRGMAGASNVEPAESAHPTHSCSSPSSVVGNQCERTKHLEAVKQKQIFFTIIHFQLLDRNIKHVIQSTVKTEVLTTSDYNVCKWK